MASVTESYKNDNLEDIRGSEMYSSAGGISGRMVDNTEKRSGEVLNEMINRRLSPTINYSRNDDREPDQAKSSKSPRRMNGDSTIQPPSKKECLSSSSQANSVNMPLNGINGTVTPKSGQSAFPRMTSIPPSALFGFNPTSVGCLSPLTNGANPLSALGLGNMNQNAMAIQQLTHAIENQNILNQLATVQALSYLQSPATNLLHGNNMNADIQPRTLDHLKQVISPNTLPKTSTPKGKQQTFNRSSFLTGVGNSSGYVTDSSFNTTTENSLNDLVSRMALLPHNKQDNLMSALNASNTAAGNTSATASAEDTSLDYIRDSRWVNMNYVDPQNQGFAGAVEQLAENHRKSAASSEATCTWVGLLPPKMYKNPIYSCKVFLGGVPWDITEPQLQSQFKQFGAVTVDWPGKDKSHAKNPPSGYVYLIFENEKAIRSLLTACTTDFSNGKTIDGYFFKLSSKRTRGKEVQVIPWVLADSNFSRVPQGSRTETTRTVFVGALHGMLNAEALSTIMNDLFGGVTFAGIDTDKYKYPIGSGRVSFNNDRSYMKAVSAGFIEIKAHKFNKKVQVDPYLDDHICSACQQVQGQYFCREVTCFTYFCLPCWNWHHSIEALKPHVPLTRNSKMKNSNASMPPVTALSALPPTPFGMDLTQAPEGATNANLSLMALQSQTAMANALAANHSNLFGGGGINDNGGASSSSSNNGMINANNVCDSLAAILENANNTCINSTATSSFSAIQNFRAPTTSTGVATTNNVF